MSAQPAVAEDVKVAPIIACIAIAIAASVGTFVMTWSLAFAIIGYLVVACVAYVALWVMGYA